MAGSLQETPGANRLHIGVFGRTNSGKSSFLNAFAGQEISIVADVAGTTTDPVTKAMEIAPLGPCALIDTAGFGDESELGARRMERTKLAAEKTELAVLLFPADVIAEREAAAEAGGRKVGQEAAATAAESWKEELRWYQQFKKQGIPVLPVLSKADCLMLPESEEAPAVSLREAGAGDEERNKQPLLSAALEEIRELTGTDPLPVSVVTGSAVAVSAVAGSAVAGAGISRVREALARLLPEDYDSRTITGSLCGADDVVLLVMPQDIQAPKGRLILPQVQTIRELLDKKCIVMSVTTDRLPRALAALAAPPKLIITDSQVFGEVYRLKPAESMLTSFSVLFAAYKGDLLYYIEGAAAIDSLTSDSHVLIAECCTHAPLTEDIGRVKIPRMLKKRFGEGITVDLVSGTDFPEDLTGYDLIIQCGACMFNRRYVLARIDRAKRQQIPMTNYGVTIAHLTGILDKISYEGKERTMEYHSS